MCMRTECANLLLEQSVDLLMMYDFIFRLQVNMFTEHDRRTMDAAIDPAYTNAIGSQLINADPNDASEEILNETYSAFIHMPPEINSTRLGDDWQNQK